MFLRSFFSFICLAYLLSACSSRPSVSTTVPEPESNTKKSESVKKETIRIDVKDDQGVFDDHYFQLKTNLDKWKLIDERNGIKTYEKIKSDSGLVAFRGEILIPASLKKIATVLDDDQLQKEWVDSLVEMREISRKNEFEHIQYNQTKVPWPFQNREFVFRVIARANMNPPTLLIHMKSINDTSVPNADGVVRGEIINSYYYLKEIKGLTATKMIVEMEVDPKGAIPLWLVNLSQKNWPHNTLQAVKKISLRDDLPVLPKFEKYFEEVKTAKKGVKKK